MQDMEDGYYDDGAPAPLLLRLILGITPVLVLIGLGFAVYSFLF